jgi:hypothetical protein
MFEITHLEFLSYSCGVSCSYTGELLKCLGVPPQISFQIHHFTIENLRITVRALYGLYWV